MKKSPLTTVLATPATPPRPGADDTAPGASPPAPFDPATVAVGSPVWVDDSYNNSPRWVECAVTAVGRRYWTVVYRGSAIRVPRDPEAGRDPRVREAVSPNGCGPTVYLTREAMADAQWIGRYRHVLQAKVGSCPHADLLRAVAALLGLDLP